MTPESRHLLKMRRRRVRRLARKNSPLMKQMEAMAETMERELSEVSGRNPYSGIWDKDFITEPTLLIDPGTKKDPSQPEG